MRNGGLFWGFLLVVIGGLLLAQNFNLIPPGVNIWALFWPLALITFGGLLLLRASGGWRARIDSARVTLDGAARGVLRLHHGAGELRIQSGAAQDELFRGEFGGGLDRRIERPAGEVRVELRTPPDVFPVFGPFPSDGFHWNMLLNPGIPLSLDMVLGASRSLINLRDLKVTDLKLQTGASATELELPAAAGSTRAVIRAGVASVDIIIPQGVAARIHTGGGLAAVTIDRERFPQVGGEYRSPDFDTAANRLDLDVETGVGALTIR